MDWQDDGIVLSARRHGETSAVVRVLTADHGVHAGLVRGGYSKRQRANIEPGNRVHAKWRGRLSEQLGAYTLETVHAHGAQLMEDPNRLAALASAMTLVETVLPEREPHRATFEALLVLLGGMENDEFSNNVLAWGSLYIKWEMGVLSELGFQLDLSHCAATGGTDDLIWVSPKSARAVSKQAGEPYQHQLLPLPQFLRNNGAVAENLFDIYNGLKLMGYFINRHLLVVHDKRMPSARSRLVERMTHLLDR
ncbi:MAG: DNA repair protein RecO [Magnetovibrio sp.]|nr:DNA repair protein RecO [Magnetovibrio sp.]